MNKIKLSNGRSVKVFFDCPNSMDGYKNATPEEIMAAITSCRIFIRTGWDSEPERVLLQSIEEIDPQFLEGVDKAAPGLAVCNANGEAMFSLVYWDEKNGCPKDQVGIYVFSLRDMLYR